jgi:hypothetical protein
MTILDAPRKGAAAPEARPGFPVMRNDIFYLFLKNGF